MLTFFNISLIKNVQQHLYKQYVKEEYYNSAQHINNNKYIQKSMYAYIKSNIEHKIHKSD